MGYSVGSDSFGKKSKMEPQRNVAQKLDSSHLQAIFDRFVKFLIKEKILIKGNKWLNLSLAQLKTIYNIHCKYNEDFCTSDSIVDFEDLRQFAVAKQNLIIKPVKRIFPTFGIITLNAMRENLDRHLDEIAMKQDETRAASEPAGREWF